MVPLGGVLVPGLPAQLPRHSQHRTTWEPRGGVLGSPWILEIGVGTFLVEGPNSTFQGLGRQPPGSHLIIILSITQHGSLGVGYRNSCEMGIFVLGLNPKGAQGRGWLRISATVPAMHDSRPGSHRGAWWLS